MAKRRLPTALVLRPLLDAGWTIVRKYERDGETYVVARKSAAAPFDGLSRREAEAVSRLARGELNKVIAYEMGISASTVGVLLWRASRKLGAHSRNDLIALLRNGFEGIEAG